MTQRRPQVFISYSGYRGVVKELIDALRAELPRQGFEPTWDRDTQLGKKFRGPVEELVRNCDAALVIVSHRALKDKRRWVFAEACWLQLRGEGVQVVPIYVEGLDRADLPDNWEQTGLYERSGIVIEDDLRQSVDAIVNALEDTGQRVLATPVEYGLRDRLAGLEEDRLKRAAAPIAGEPPPWRPGQVALQVATRLLKAPAGRAWRTLQALALIDLNEAQVCARIALPFTWVDRDTADRLGATIEHRQPVVLNVVHERVRICEAYVRTGTTMWPAWPLLDIAVSWDPEEIENLVQCVEDELDVIGDEYDLGEDDGPSATDRSPAVVLAVPCPGLDAEIIRQVTKAVARRPGVALLFLAGDASWEDAPVEIRDEMHYEQITIDDAHTKGVARWESASLRLCTYRQHALGAPRECR